MEDENKVPATQTGGEGKTSDPSHITRTPEEIAAFNLKKKAEDAAALGIDPKKVLGLNTEDSNEIPAWYKQEKAKEAKETALSMADSIVDPETKEAVKQFLQTRIVPSGNPQQDFRDALGLASSAKNKQVIEEIQRYTSPRTVAAGGDLPPKIEEEFVPTEQERIFMAPPYNMSKEKIIQARRREQAK